jgi:hypothetical protein
VKSPEDSNLKRSFCNICLRHDYVLLPVKRHEAEPILDWKFEVRSRARASSKCPTIGNREQTNHHHRKTSSPYTLLHTFSCYCAAPSTRSTFRAFSTRQSRFPEELRSPAPAPLRFQTFLHSSIYSINAPTATTCHSLNKDRRRHQDCCSTPRHTHEKLSSLTTCTLRPQ